MRRLSGRERLLLGVLGLSAAILWIRAPNGSVGLVDRPGRFGAGLELGDPPLIRLDLLERSVTDFDADGRDLFEYVNPGTHQTARRRREAHAPRRDGPEREKGVTSASTPATPAPPSPSFSYIGLLGPRDNRIAVFNKGDEVLVAQVGDVIDRSFQLLEFRHEAVVLGCIDEQYRCKTLLLGRSSG